MSELRGDDGSSSFRQQFEIPEVPARCVDCSNVCTLVGMIAAEQAEIDDHFGVAQDSDSLQQRDPRLAQKLLAPYPNYAQRVRNGEITGPYRERQAAYAASIADAVGTCVGRSAWSGCRSDAYSQPGLRTEVGRAVRATSARAARLAIAAANFVSSALIGRAPAESTTEN